jgi:hypothetical protein
MGLTVRFQPSGHSLISKVAPLPSAASVSHCHYPEKKRYHTIDNFIRLPALMDLYIHPLYVLVSKILFSILNSTALIYPLYHPLSTLSTVESTCHFI